MGRACGVREKCAGSRGVYRSGRPFGTHLELECALEQRLRLLVVRGALGEADAAVRRHGVGGERRGLADGGAEDAEGFGHVARRERELVQLLVDLQGGGARRQNCAEKLRGKLRGELRGPHLADRHVRLGDDRRVHRGVALGVLLLVVL